MGNPLYIRYKFFPRFPSEQDAKEFYEENRDHFNGAPELDLVAQIEERDMALAQFRFRHEVDEALQVQRNGGKVAISYITSKRHRISTMSIFYKQLDKLPIEKSEGGAIANFKTLNQLLEDERKVLLSPKER